MVFTSPTDDIILQEGVFAYDFDASGAISKGAAVFPGKTGLYVSVPDAGADFVPHCIGIAAYAVADTKPVAIYGPGNIVRACLSGTCTVGDQLVCCGEGMLLKKDGNPSGARFIALETVATDAATVKVLIM